MNKSESIKNIAIALSKFQGEVQNPKNTADNPYFNSKYAPLSDVLNIVRPILSKYGLSVLQSPSSDAQNIIISTMLMHESGEWIELEPLTLKADKQTAQGTGSAITYGRRYALSAILGISSEDDDDGNHATGDGEKAANTSNSEKPKNEGHKESSKAKSESKNEDKNKTDSGFQCESCGTEITKAEKSYSEHYFGKLLCKGCQKIYQKAQGK